MTSTLPTRDGVPPGGVVGGETVAMGVPVMGIPLITCITIGPIRKLDRYPLNKSDKTNTTIP